MQHSKWLTALVWDLSWEELLFAIVLQSGNKFPNYSRNNLGMRFPFFALLPLATMSVSLSPCSVPGQKPNFTLEEDEMELGLGKQVTSH